MYFRSLIPHSVEPLSRHYIRALNLILIPHCVFQTKYKEASKKQTSTSLYHRLPETLETQHAKEASQLQSQVRTDVMSSSPPPPQ